MDKNKKNVIILGAGPSGLSLAYELIKSGAGFKPIIIDKLPVVGGLSRTVYFDNLGLDIGGHRLYTQDKYIQSIWNDFLPVQNFPSIDDKISKREAKYPTGELNPEIDDDVMLLRKRFSSIIFKSKFFDYPLKINLNTIKNLGFKTTIQAGFSYIKSIFIKREEKTLEDFLINRFGNVLYEIFFKDYTKKVWGVDASILSSEWGHQRIRKLSLLKTVLNAVFSKIFFFKKDHSLIDTFFYPKFGCSQLWNKMAEYIVNNGGEIILNSEFAEFNVKDNKIISLKYKKDNQFFEIPANYFVSSIPIKDLIKGIDAPFDIKQNALNLPYRDYILAGFYLNDFNLFETTKYKTVNNKTKDCWIYLQEKDAIAARIQFMNNWSPYLVGDCSKNYLVSLEYYANKGDDFWNLSDDEIIKLATKEAQKYNLFDKQNILKTFLIREENAYPSYFGTYQNIENIRKFLNSIDNLYLIGRNGQHKYNNMDEAMISGIDAAREIIKNGK